LAVASFTLPNAVIGALNSRPQALQAATTGIARMRFTIRIARSAMAEVFHMRE
jgi:hypothetical protein